MAVFGFVDVDALLRAEAFLVADVLLLFDALVMVLVDESVRIDAFV